MRAASRARTRFRRILQGNETGSGPRHCSHLRDRRSAGFPFVWPQPVGGSIADVVCRALRFLVGADGSQQAGNRRDHVRDAWLAAGGDRGLRFWNIDIMQQTECVSATILAALPASPRLRGKALSSQATRGEGRS